MKIIACVKCVPVYYWPRAAPDGKSLDLREVSYGMSTLDEVALEEAIKIKETCGGEITFLTLGPPREAAHLGRKGLALGADRAIVLIDALWLTRDCRATAKALASRIRETGADLVLMGSASADQANAAVGPMTATYLGYSCVTEVLALSLEEGQGTARRGNRIEVGVETVAFPLPAVITCNEELNHPRYTSLKRIMRAKKLPLEEESCRGYAPQVSVESLELVVGPSHRRRNRILGSGLEAVQSLIGALYNEARVLGRD